MEEKAPRWGEETACNAIEGGYQMMGREGTSKWNEGSWYREVGMVKSGGESKWRKTGRT